MLGAWEIILIILIVIILFGGKKIPELLRGLGVGLKEFKKAKEEIVGEVNEVADEIKNVSNNDKK